MVRKLTKVPAGGFEKASRIVLQKSLLLVKSGGIRALIKGVPSAPGVH